MSTYQQSSEMASNSSSENGKGNLQINWDLIGEVSEAFESVGNRYDEKLSSLLVRKKVEMEEHLNSIICDVVCLTERKSHSGGDEDFHSDASSLTEDLNTLLSLFRTSEYDSKAMTEMEELLKSLEWRRPQIDALLSLLVGQNYPNAVFDSEVQDEKNSDSNLNDVEEEDIKTEDHNVEDGGRKTEDHNVEEEDIKTEDHNVEHEDRKTEDSKFDDEDREIEESEAAASNPSNSRGKGKKKNTNKGKGGKRK